MLNNLLNLLRYGCAHEHIGRAIKGRVRCLDCGRFRFMFRSQWFRDRIAIRRAA